MNMSDIVADPTTLTKDRLKKELSRHNVRLPPSDSRKDAYVALYREHVVPLLEKRVSEFSSDDEILIPQRQSKSPRKKTSSPKKSPKKAISKSDSDSLSAEEMEVSRLSDEELSARLKELGVDVGPIIASTRRVYERKLLSLLAEGVSAEGSHGTEDKLMQDEVDTQIITQTQSTDDTMPISDLDDDILEQPAPVTKSHIRKRQPIHASYQPSDNQNSNQTTPMTVFQTDKANEAVSQAQDSATGQQKKGFSILSQILIFVGVALLVYIFMQSMDSKPANRIPIST